MPLDHFFLNQAYHLALQNAGCTSPNPSVGAVVVQADRVVGQGFHSGAGQAHAEVVALERAGESARNATLYCSLEPCCHYGKTPPCTQRIQGSGIARVVFGATDRNPLVNGMGRQALEKAGIAADQINNAAVERFYAPFFRTFETGRPYVISKMGLTANGIIAPADRNSRWITNETSRAWVHQLRAQCDAILVGADTVIQDQPQLTVRVEGVERKPVRIVMDRSFKVAPETCSILRDDSPVLICGSDSAPQEKERVWQGTRVETIRFRQLDSLLSELLSRGIRKILVEGGQKIFTLFHTAGLIDEYVLIVAPRLLTGNNSLNVLSGPDQPLSTSQRFTIDPPVELNGDIILRMRSASK